MTLISGLKSASVQELEPVPIRHIAMLSSLGYLCTSSWIAEAIQSRMAMVLFILQHLATLCILQSNSYDHHIADLGHAGRFVFLKYYVLYTSIRAVNDRQVIAVDRVIGADMGSEAAYGALWDLASMSRFLTSQDHSF